jgi:uncharacterized protein (TIGR03435 family)
MLKRLPAVVAACMWVVVIVTPSFGCAQSSSAAQRPTFEVASIRPAVTQGAGGEGSTRSQIETAPDGLIMRNISLGEMVEWAYGLEHAQVLGPGMLENRRFDVRTRTAQPEPDATLRLMLQNLLAARFNLKLHHEKKPTSVYELVAGKRGPRLPPDKSSKLPASYPRERFPRVVDGSFVFTNTSMAEFAQQLTELRGIDLPVVDRTGIQGVYDITLKGAAAAMLQTDGPSLLTLIREQLGLKLVAAKDPMEVIVVEHAEEPSGN